MFSLVNGQFVPNSTTPPTILSTPLDVGIGTTTPEAKTEIFYCKPKSGLYITKDYCLNTNGAGTYNGGLLGDTYNETTGGGGNNTGTGILQYPIYINPFLNAGTPYSVFSTPSKPMLWLRTYTPQITNPTSPLLNRTKFIVLDNGRTGIHTTDPRAMLDINQANSAYNQISAIFGVRQNSTGILNPITNLNKYFTQHLSIMPKVYAKYNNDIVQHGDITMFFTDGLGPDGSNSSGALVIAPETKNPNVGGLRMDAIGNVELRGDLQCLKLTVKADWWSDFVFDEAYKLKPLNEVEAFINKNKHLPNMPSEKQVINSGQNLGELQNLQQRKIEELTLYLIQQKKKIDNQNAKLELQEKKLLKQQQLLAEQMKRLKALETLMDKQ